MPPKRLKPAGTATAAAAGVGTAAATVYPVSKKPVIVDRFDQAKVKQTLDEATEKYFTDVIKQPADHTYVDLRIGISLLAVALACVAQFYPRPFPENKAVLAVCVVLYIVCQVVMQYIASYKQKNIVYRSKPGPNGGRIIVCSDMLKYSDKYQLQIQDTSDQSQYQFEQSITRWWTEANVFVESAFWADLEAAIDGKSE